MLGNLFGQKQTISQPTASSVQPIVESTDSVQTVGSSMSPAKRLDLSVLSHLDARTTTVLTHAEEEAKKIKQATIEIDQLFLGLLFDSEIFQLLTSSGANPAQVSSQIQERQKMGVSETQPSLGETSKHIFEQAYTLAKNHDAEFVSPEDILMAFISSANASSVLQVLTTSGFSKEKLQEVLSKSTGESFGKRTVLDKFGIDLTMQAQKGELDPIAGRDKEIERVTHILLRRSKNNPIIIGEAGVGKTAVVEGLAQSIMQKTAPKDLWNKKIIQLDLSSLVAGASHRGEFEERLRSVIKETQTAGNVVLFIDEIHTLIGAGDTQGALDASNIVKPFLARGQLQIIGTTTTAEYRKYFEKDKAFARRFQPIIVDEPTEEVAQQMIETLKPKYEKFHNVVVTPEAIKASVHLSKKYIGERYLPDKAVDLLDEAAADVKLEVGQGKRQDNNVVESDIQKVVSSWTGIPISKLTEDESQKLLSLEKLIHERLIGQDEAVKVVAEAVRRGRIGLASPNRPISSFIFLGPTGTGKTELAKTLAEILFGRDDAMIRLDMSEYMEKHEVAKLIGAPPGYVGYDEGGQLTEAVRAKPYSIVLLDEVEKAHPDVFNILLQLLEDGRLTDNKGNTISFKNTIVIATSNIGSAMIQEKLGQTVQNPSLEEKNALFSELSKVLMGELVKFFRPELVNRFDGVVVFKPLAQNEMLFIAKLGIVKTKKLLKEQGLDLSISDNALNQLALEGYDPVYGARPLRRLIQTAIENPIALLIIGKTFVTGDMITIDYDSAKQEFVFVKASAQTIPASLSQPESQVVESTPLQAVMPPPLPSANSSQQAAIGT